MIPILEDIIRGLLDGTMSHEDARHYLELHESLRREQRGEEPTEAEMRADIAQLVGEDNPELLALCDAHDYAGIMIYVTKRFEALGL